MVTALSFSGICADSDHYLTLDRYIELHPEEAVLMSGFKSLVSGVPEPVNRRLNKPVVISVIYPGIQKSNYWRDSVTSMKARLDELGVRYDVKQYFSKPSGDYRLQAKQFAEAVKSNSDYIAISADNENIKRLVSAILIKQQPKIIIQNLTTPLREWDDYPPFLYVGFDHIEGSRLIADQYAELFPKGGKYLMLYGSKGTVSELRGGGFERYGLSRGFVPAAKFYTNFSTEKAYESVKTALTRNPEISFVYACSTDIAIGASRALEEMGLLGEVLVNGWGGTLNELKLIKQGKLDFTVMRMNDDNGVAIAEAVKFDILGRAELIPHVFSGELVTVSQKMEPAEIDKLTERALRYSAQ